MESDGEMEQEGVTDDLVERLVVRDGPLPRFAADLAIPAYLGRDIEISFLTYTTKLHAEVSRRTTEDSQSRGMKMSGELLELSRVRVPPPIARDLAMSLIRELVEKGLVDLAQVNAEISAMTSEHHSDDGSGAR